MWISRSFLSGLLLLTVADMILSEEDTHDLLSRNVPIFYTIKIEPHIIQGNFTFNGETNIDIAVNGAPRKTITVHAASLKFDEEYTSLVSAGNDNTMKPVKHYHESELLILEFENTIVAGNYTLNFKYIGECRHCGEEMNHDGTELWLVMNDLNSNRARRVFPCFDEPALKAQFKIAIKHFGNYTAVSNMPVSDATKADEEKIWTHFHATPVISTHMVAIVVSNYKNVTSDDGRIGVWARESMIESSRYALQIAPKVLQLLENYTDMHRVFPMINLFTFDDASYDTNSWSLITVPEYTKSPYQPIDWEDLMLDTIVNRFIRQWFGNLVTPESSKEAWVMDGFLLYLGSMIFEKTVPDMHLMDHYIIVFLQDYAFDPYRKISAKAPFIFRMFAYAIGEKGFQAGLQRYLRNHSYSTATVDDLLNCITSVVGDSALKDKMKQRLVTWMNQPGYPMVNAVNTNDGHVHISARHYSPEEWNSKIYQNKFVVPINIAQNPAFNDTKLDAWLEPKSQLALEIDSTRWYIINKQQTGFYRVNYDMNNWRSLAEYLRTEDYHHIHVLNRAQLLDDSYNFARSGYLDDYEIFFDISTYLEREVNFISWYPVYKPFERLDASLRNTDLYELFQRYVVKLITKIDKTIVYSLLPGDDNKIIGFYKFMIMEIACLAGSVSCRNATHEILVSYINGEINETSLGEPRHILCAGMRSANATIWNKTFEMMEANDYHDDPYLRIKTVLSCSSDPTILKLYLQKLIAPNSSLSQSAESIISDIVHKSAIGVNVAFTFIKENFAAVIERCGHMTVEKSLFTIASAMNTLTQMDELENFIESLPAENEELAKDLEKGALPAAGRNVKWYEQHGKKIGEFLRSQDV